MKIYAPSLLPVYTGFLLAFLTGCTSSPSSPSSPSSQTEAPPAPKRELLELPQYRAPGKPDAAEKAVCGLLPLGTSTPFSAQIAADLRAILQQNGYTVLDFSTPPTAEERAACGTVIGYGKYAQRESVISNGVPVVDVVLFFHLLPRSKQGEPSGNLREFHAWGRQFSDKTPPVEAIHQAVGNLISNPAFRNALKP